MTRLMKREGSYLLIAKVLVISRLLHKALGQAKSKPPIVDELWERLLSVRRKLLRRIDKRLSSTTGEAASLVESMCAYALATSSPPTDVLNHFHKVRLARINSELKEGGDELAKHGISTLKLCIQTCLDTQMIFPRRLAEALAKLKQHPLIQDPDVRGLHELNLDVLDRWLGEEARKYTPWPRHDELQRPEAERILHRWSKDAIAAFLKGIKKALDGEERLKEVASLRQDLIETWILSGSRMAGVKSTNVLDDLRDTMNEKLENIVQSRTQGLKAVVSELTSQLNAMTVDSNQWKLSLWSSTVKTSDLGNGAQNFKTTILNTYQGRNEPIRKVTSAFDKWMDSVLEVRGIVKGMKEARWDDTFADDVDDESDDELGNSKQILLSDDDPKLLEETTQEALREALRVLGKSFSLVVKSSTEQRNEVEVQKAVFILRAIREIGDRIPQLSLQDKLTPLESPFTAEILQPLHVAVAASIVDPTTKVYQEALRVSSRIKTSSHILWEGNPPLPSQPSPSTFRFLRELNKSMAALGSDLWGPGSVLVLKSKVLETLVHVYQDHIKECDALGENEVAEEVEEKPAEGGEPPANAEDEGKEKPANDGIEEAGVTVPTDTSSQELKDQKIKQLLFDALYVQRLLSSNSIETKAGTTELVAQANLEALGEASIKRLRKNAADFVKKTYLLFALLA